MKTFLPKVNEIERDWILIDATNLPLGRLAAEVATILRGKNKTTFTPHLDVGDFVVVINAEKVALSGNKEEQKIYKNYTGYAGGLKEYKAAFIRETNPTRMVKQAVHGMLPKNRLGRQLEGKLKIYVGTEHPHEAQQPKVLELSF